MENKPLDLVEISSRLQHFIEEKIDPNVKTIDSGIYGNYIYQSISLFENSSRLFIYDNRICFEDIFYSEKFINKLCTFDLLSFIASLYSTTKISFEIIPSTNTYDLIIHIG